MLMPNAPAANVGLHDRRQGAASTRPVSACASGNEAIALGIDLIRLGRADVVVVGGTEAADPPAADGGLRPDDGAVQAQRRAPSAASRPWDNGRDGFVLGEGAAVLVLESEEHAAGPRRQGLRRGRRRRHHRRLPRHRPARPRRARRHPGDEDGAARGRPRRRPTSCTSTPTPPRPRRATSPRA